MENDSRHLGDDFAGVQSVPKLTASSLLCCVFRVGLYATDSSLIITLGSDTCVPTLNRFSCLFSQRELGVKKLFSGNWVTISLEFNWHVNLQRREFCCMANGVLLSAF